MKLFSLVFVLLSAGAHALTPFEATYHLTWDMGITLSGKAVQRVVPNGEGWRMTQDAKASVGSMNEQSLFRTRDNGTLMPLEFSRETSVLGRNKLQTYRFNWNLNKAQLDETEIDLPENTFDPLTLQLALRAALQNGESLSINLADRGRVRSYSFSKSGPETVKTRAGDFNAYKLSYTGEGNRLTELWFDPQQDYLMVRMRAQRDDRSFEIELMDSKLLEQDAYAGS